MSMFSYYGYIIFFFFFKEYAQNQKSDPPHGFILDTLPPRKRNNPKLTPKKLNDLRMCIQQCNKHGSLSSRKLEAQLNL